jgi:FkbM family methyltransferase
MNQTEWTAFADRARSDGKLIELVIKDVYVSNFPADGVALDGGGNVGYHTKGLAEHLTAGRVISVEANRATYETLLRNTSRFSNVTAVYAALQDDPGRQTVTFNCSPSHPGRSGISRLWDTISPGKVAYEPAAAVPATTIDKLVREHGLARLDFIKLDLEGGEYHAMRGAEHSLRTLRPLVVSEHSIHAPKLNGFDIAVYFEWLRGLGYTPMAPNGELVELSRPFPFWYVFLVPTETLPRWRDCIGLSLDRIGLAPPAAA